MPIARGQALFLCPLYFVRSGYVSVPGVNNGTFRYAGVNTEDWSSRGVAATTAYNLNFNATGVNPSSGPVNRYSGRSLRCLSTVLNI